MNFKNFIETNDKLLTKFLYYYFIILVVSETIVGLFYYNWWWIVYIEVMPLIIFAACAIYYTVKEKILFCGEYK